MFFYLSKLGLLLLQPSSLCAAAIGAGLLMSAWPSKARTGRRIATGGLIALVVLGFSPVANLMLLPLEHRFPRPDLSAIGPRVAGLVILGGFEDTWVSGGRQELALTDAAERLTEAVRLAQRLPAAKVVFTGGAADLVTAEGAADLVREYLIAFGVAAERIILERTSRTTDENARNTRDIVKPRPGDVWLLVTSAQHMPRAIGVFRGSGFDVVAWPVDYRTAGNGRDGLSGFRMISEGLRRADHAAKEWYGLFGYWVAGRSRDLFPAP
jgi:uncharacterized SAM-binding protein YcdF (DUF218 family)